MPVRLGPVGIVILSAYQLLQELQLPPAQPAHPPPPPPAIGTAVPNELTERQAKRDKALFALCLHIGQSAGSLDWLIGRISSNLVLQSGQIYS
jgi:hypothetical protein